MLADFRPDVLLADVGMPGEDGYSLIRKVRALPDGRLARVPAVAVTAYARGEDRQAAVDAGFDRHLAKPFEPSELAALVATLAGRSGDL
jgi:CheY-like chemotaxis protein